MLNNSRLWLATVSLAVVGLVAACGGSSSTSEPSAAPVQEPAASAAAPAASEAPAEITLDGGGKSITVFMPSTSNNYIAEWARGLKATAAELNYEVTTVENNFDQAEQDLQIQQALASGTKPDLYVFWPSDAKAGIAALRSLAQTGVPVVQANQGPSDEAWPYLVMYAGVDDYLNGYTSGELMLGAREVAQAAGKTFASPEGNLIEIMFVPGYEAGITRSAAFREATGAKPFNIIASENAGFDNESGYNVMSQLIPANKAKGIDFVYAHNDALAAGAIKALEEAGLVPGKDVYIVGGTCHGDLSALESGKQYGSGLQAAGLEGNGVMLAVARYFANDGVVQDGEERPDPSPDFPSTTAAPFKYNFIPNPGLVFTGDSAANSAQLDEYVMWGDSMRNLCTY